VLFFHIAPTIPYTYVSTYAEDRAWSQMVAQISKWVSIFQRSDASSNKQKVTTQK